MSMKKSSDTIRNRTRDLLACSAVPQPTAPPRSPIIMMVINNMYVCRFSISRGKKSDQEEKKPRRRMWNVETNKRDTSNNVDKRKGFKLHHKIPDTQYLPCIQSHRSAVQVSIKTTNRLLAGRSAVRIRQGQEVPLLL